MAMRIRMANITSQCEWTEDGNVHTLTEDTIKIALAHKVVKRSAYIKHDKDIITEYDVANDKRNILTKEDIGRHKKPHWHIVIEFSTPTDLENVAKWFGVAPNFVDVPKGRDAFIDCVQYLTHERTEQQELGKQIYQDSEVRASFDFRSAIDEYEVKKTRYGTTLDKADEILYDIVHNGMTLSKAVDKDKVAYMKNFSKYAKARADYISRQTPPKTRINYYIYGKGGSGKGLLSRALAKALYPNLEEYDCFFEVGARGSAFEGYDGQPVIIWNDRRAIDLLNELNGRGNVFNIFDTHPTKQRQNVKYGSINLCNAVNIVNSVDDYKTFMDGLAGNYVDKEGTEHFAEDDGQAYRRFPLIIPIHQDDFDIMVNKGVMEDTDVFTQYIEYNKMRGNMQRLVTKLSEQQELCERLQGQMVQPIVDVHRELEHKYDNQNITDEDLEEFKYYGMSPQQIEEAELNEFLQRLVNDEIKDNDEILARMEMYEYLPTEQEVFITDCYGEAERRGIKKEGKE